MSLTVAINAQIMPNRGAGGVEAVLIGLVDALHRLEGPEQYVIVGPTEDPDWLRPYLGANQTTVPGPPVRGVKRALRSVKPLVRLTRRGSSWVRNTGQSWPRLAHSNGFFEALGCRVVHFPLGQFVVSSVPAVFNPHDLQHVHFPQFFSRVERTWKDVTRGAGCKLAHTVTVSSEWVRQDIVRHYGIAPEKIRVIPWAPPTQVYREPTPAILEALRHKYELPHEFALYPAMTWPHKNHIRLLEALALLRDRRHLQVNLVCTGHQNDFWRHIEHRMTQLGLEKNVRFLGFVPGEDLRGLYRLAQFMVFPTLFEAAGGPLVEAWQEGTAVACAAITSLPEQVGDAALLFDPRSVQDISDALARMATDPSLRETLRQRGFARLPRFNWEATAKAYRAVYRHAAGCSLTEEDRHLLSGGRT